MSLVADLNQNRGKGAALFQKRKARSEKWVIDENNVKKPGTQSTATYIGVGTFIMIYLNMIVFLYSQQLNHGVNEHHHHGLVMKDLILGLVFHQINRNLIFPQLLLYLNQCFHLHQHKLFQDLEILMRNQKVLVLEMQIVNMFFF